MNDSDAISGAIKWLKNDQLIKDDKLNQRSQKWFSNVSGGAVCHAWITYDSDLKNLSVSFTGFRNSVAFRQDGLYYTIDLRDVLPEWVIFGFSAATGALFQKNNVKSWAFNSSDLRVDEEKVMPPDPGPGPVVENTSKALMVLQVKQYAWVSYIWDPIRRLLVGALPRPLDDDHLLGSNFREGQ
ncbi:hypothetical protein L1987_11995 [Smallanthus sonchifolius]|uniref:Uncharacterized protein n=1 Tax=Smallanthus sonchifolius TaxID=185202 RepID=A0ACB9JDF1_9ASTR|nr:hypothetical protein L1987_11995 [Smallanthus sonchifolius]